MKIINDLSRLKACPGPLILAAGFFDGVHRGHRKVIDRALARAAEVDGQAWALTFDIHPVRVLNPTMAPPLLTSNAHKLKLLARLGLDGCLMLSFTRKLAAQEPEAFIARLLACSPPLTEIHVGRNWRFGRNGRGGPAMLARSSRGLDFKVNVTRPIIRLGRTISSTRIREEVKRGRLDEAAAMLGRPFSLLGTVTGGRRMGRRLGFPTANLDCHNEVLPPSGVYAVRVLLAGKFLDGALNLGVCPTLRPSGPAPRTLEVHLLDARGDWYGCDMEVFFLERLRGERRFSSAAALKAQIGGDIARVRSILSKIPMSVWP